MLLIFEEPKPHSQDLIFMYLIDSDILVPHLKNTHSHKFICFYIQ